MKERQSIFSKRRLLAASMLSLAACLTLEPMAGTADARIKVPSMEELVDDADLIVIGRCESVEATPSAYCRQVGWTVALVPSALLLAFLVWKRRFANAVWLVVVCGFVWALFGDPIGEYQKAAIVSVSSTIKGAASPDEISIYYEDDFVCDVTHFDAEQEYLLFLNELPSGYRASWRDYSVWAIEAGRARPGRWKWHDKQPADLGELISTIEEIRDRGEENVSAPK